jgi:hypothetical protein
MLDTILDRHRQWIIEDTGGLFKPDTVLAEVDVRFG